MNPIPTHWLFRFRFAPDICHGCHIHKASPRDLQANSSFSRTPVFFSVLVSRLVWLALTPPSHEPLKTAPSNAIARCCRLTRRFPFLDRMNLRQTSDFQQGTDCHSAAELCVPNICSRASRHGRCSNYLVFRHET